MFEKMRVRWDVLPKAKMGRKLRAVTFLNCYKQVFKKYNGVPTDLRFSDGGKHFLEGFEYCLNLNPCERE